MSDIDAIISRMVQASGAKNVTQMLDIVGFSNSSASAWRRRKNIPEGSIARVAAHTGVRVEWLKTGEGERKEGMSEFRYTHPAPEVEALVEEGLGEYSSDKMTLTKDEVRVIQMWRGMSEERKHQAIMVLVNGYLESKDEGEGKD